MTVKPMATYDELYRPEEVYEDNDGRAHYVDDDGRAHYVDNDRDPLVDLCRARMERKLLNSAAVDLLDPPTFLIDGLLVDNSLALLYGHPGRFKSIVAMDWALSLATGSWWFKRELGKRFVLYVVAEGASGIRPRKQAWQEDRGICEVGGIAFLPAAVNLLDRVQAEALAELAADYGNDGLIVIDTLSRCMSGGDENSAADMTKIVDRLEHIRQTSDATVLVVHHTPKTGGTPRGHSALEGAVETAIECDADGGTVVLKCAKQKDAKPFEPIRLSARPVAQSVVLVSHGGVGQADDLRDSERALMAVMRDNFGTTGAGNKALMEVSALPRSSYYRAVNSLLSVGVLRNDGTDKRPHWKLTEEPAS